MTKSNSHKKLIARNRKASYQYFLETPFEAGIVLTGSEVKSLREGKASIEESYAHNIGEELFLFNCNISPYHQNSISVQEPVRPRKLLCKRKEINKLLGKIHTKGYTLVPMSIYFNSIGLVKVELALGLGKKLYDKRQTIAKRDLDKEQRRKFKHS